MVFVSYVTIQTPISRSLTISPNNTSVSLPDPLVDYRSLLCIPAHYRSQEIAPCNNVYWEWRLNIEATKRRRQGTACGIKRLQQRKLISGTIF